MKERCLSIEGYVGVTGQEEREIHSRRTGETWAKGKVFMEYLVTSIKSVRGDQILVGFASLRNEVDPKDNWDSWKLSRWVTQTDYYFKYIDLAGFCTTYLKRLRTEAGKRVSFPSPQERWTVFKLTPWQSGGRTLTGLKTLSKPGRMFTARCNLSLCSGFQQGWWAK